MWPKLDSRRSERGNSFTTCLLTVVVVFGGIGFYYFNYFQWRHFEAPLEGLTWVKDADQPQLNTFRKTTVSKVLDGTKVQLDKVTALRKKSKKGTEKPEDFEQSVTEIRNRLLELMTEARLRRIPKKFEKHYKQTIMTIVYTYNAINEFENSFKYETVAEREKGYKKSLESSSKAWKNYRSARDYFHGEAWSQ